MAISKRPVIGLALAYAVSFGAAQGQPAWVALDGLPPAPVEGVVAVGNVLLAKGSHHIFRTTSAEGPWSATLSLTNSEQEFLQAMDSLVFAGDGAQLYASLDRGLTWTPAHMDAWGMPQRIFRSNGSLAMVTTDGRYHSSPDGINWSTYQTSPTGESYGQLLIIDSLLFVGTDDGINVSANHGGSWKRLRNGLPDGQILMLQLVFGKLFVSIAAGGLFVSSNLGESWSKVDGGLSKAGVEYSGQMEMAASRNLLLLAVYGPGGMLGSRDSGKTWTALNQGLPSVRLGDVPWYSAFDVVFRSDTALVSTNAGIYRSTNGGALWSQANQGLPPQGDAFTSLNAAGSDLYTVNFLDSHGPAYRSGDGGRTWVRADTLLDGMRLMRTQGNDRIAMTDQGMAHSGDGGKTWASLPGPWYPDQKPIAFDFQATDLAVAEQSPGSSLFYSDDKGATWGVEKDSLPAARLGNLRFQAAANRLRVSSNEGRSWTDLPMEFPGAVASIHAGNGWLAAMSDSGLYLSADSGRSWKRPGGLPDSLPVSAVALTGSGVYAATGKGLMLSSDGGTQWKILAQGLPVVEIVAMAASAGRLFAADSHSLYLHESSSPGWKTIASAPMGIHQLAVCQNIVMAATPSDARLWISKDAGATWDSAGVPLSRQNIYSLALGPAQGFAATTRGLYRTSDSGRTWEAVPLAPSTPMDPSPTAMAFGNGNLYAVEGSKTYRHVDGGSQWSLLPAPSGWVPRFLAAEGGEMYAADGNGVHASADQGVSWTAVSPALPFDLVGRIAYGGGDLYVAGWGGTGVYALEPIPSGLRGSAPGVSAADGIRVIRVGGMTAFRFDLQGNGRVTWEAFSASGRRAGGYASRVLAPGTYSFPGTSTGSRAGLLYRAEILPEDRARAHLVRKGWIMP